MKWVSLQDNQVQRLGLPANARCRGWACGRVLARCSSDAMLMVHWRGALVCNGARGAILEVDPLPLVLLDLWLDPPPWAQPHGHRYHMADSVPPLMLPLPLCLLQPPICLPMCKWAATCLAPVGPLCSYHPWNLRTSKLSEL